MTEHAAVVDGDPIPAERVNSFLGPPRWGAGNGATSHNEPAVAGRQTEAPSVARQRRRWATQVIVTDELARRACADRGLKVPEGVSPASVLAVAETDVADLGSIVAAALAHSPPPAPSSPPWKPNRGSRRPPYGTTTTATRTASSPRRR